VFSSVAVVFAGGDVVVAENLSKM